MSRTKNIKPCNRHSRAKIRARARGFQFDIALNEYRKLIERPCFYCGNSLGSVQDSTGVGLDRINNSRGYVIENVVPCCQKCNVLKADLFTSEETKRAVVEVLEERKCKRVSSMLASLISA